MNVPQGRLLRSRVVDDPGVVLAEALDRSLSGYAILEPQDAILFDDGARGVMTFEAGVPVLVYDATTDRGGPDAVADLASPGPYRVELYELSSTALTSLHDDTALRVPPAMPAERLAGDADLAERTLDAAPDSRRTDEPTTSAVEAFLADTEKIESIRAQARAEAKRRADEWGLTSVADDAGAVVDGGTDTADGDEGTDTADGDEGTDTADGDATDRVDGATPDSS